VIFKSRNRTSDQRRASAGRNTKARRRLRCAELPNAQNYRGVLLGVRGRPRAGGRQLTAPAAHLVPRENYDRVMAVTLYYPRLNQLSERESISKFSESISEQRLGQRQRGHRENPVSVTQRAAPACAVQHLFTDDASGTSTPSNHLHPGHSERHVTQAGRVHADVTGDLGYEYDCDGAAYAQQRRLTAVNFERARPRRTPKTDLRSGLGPPGGNSPDCWPGFSLVHPVPIDTILSGRGLRRSPHRWS
jgi:hypothetical protein